MQKNKDGKRQEGEMVSKRAKYFLDVAPSHFDGLEKMIRGKNTIVLIHAKWCGHCIHFQPTWAKFATAVAKSELATHVQLLSIESDVLTELRNTKKATYNYILTGSTKHEPDSLYFPKLMVFNKALKKTSASEYTAGRSLAELKQYVESTFAPKKVGGKQLVDGRGKRGASELNEQIHGASKKYLTNMIDKMIAEYLGL